MRGHGKAFLGASLFTLIWGRSLAREDGAVDTFTEDKYLSNFLL